MRTSTKIPTSRAWEELVLLVMDPRGHTQDECNVNGKSREDSWIRFARLFTRDFAEQRSVERSSGYHRSRMFSLSVLSPSNVSKISESIRELGLVVVQRVSWISYMPSF